MRTQRNTWPDAVASGLAFLGNRRLSQFRHRDQLLYHPKRVEAGQQLLAPWPVQSRMKR